MPPHGKLGLSMAGAPTRMATTGIYPLRGVPRDLQRAVRNRAVDEKTTLHRVFL
jgi:hypothetical protein